MKALILSDLHINADFYKSQFHQIEYKKILENNIHEDYDIVLISGDVFQHTIISSNQNPYEILNYLFNGKKIVFCLGNHEFAYEDFNKTLKYWSSQQFYANQKFPNIYCLDACGKIEINNINFVGNVFWYDFSLNKNRSLMKGEIVDGWMDATIKNFDPIKQNEICRNNILSNLSKEKKNILITHMVTNWQLNYFSIEDENSIFNAYSGNFDFLKEIKDNYNIDYSICGHTHKREIKEIYNIKCINIGNDYYFRKFKIENMIIDI